MTEHADLVATTQAGRELATLLGVEGYDAPALDMILAIEKEARLAAPESAGGLDVERLARAISEDGKGAPPLWDLLTERGRNHWRDKAQQIAAEYAALGRADPVKEGEK